MALSTTPRINRAFFFSNFDWARKTTPSGFSADGSSGQAWGGLNAAGVPAHLAELQQIATIMKNQYGYDPGDFAEKSWKCTAREGRYLCAGFADDPKGGFTPRPLRPICPANIAIVGVMVAYIDNLPAPIRRMGLNPFGRAVGDEIHADLLRLLAEKKIRPVVGRRVSLAEAGRALDDHEQRRTSGRTVVQIA